MFCRSRFPSLTECKRHVREYRNLFFFLLTISYSLFFFFVWAITGPDKVIFFFFRVLLFLFIFPSSFRKGKTSLANLKASRPCPFLFRFLFLQSYCCHFFFFFRVALCKCWASPWLLILICRSFFFFSFGSLHDMWKTHKLAFDSVARRERKAEQFSSAVLVSPFSL